MKELAKYIGKVIELLNPPELSYVTLKDLTTGRVIESNAVTKNLIDANLKTGDEFEVIVQQSIDGKIHGVINKLNPKELTPEDINEISKIDIGKPRRLDFGF